MPTSPRSTADSPEAGPPRSIPGPTAWRSGEPGYESPGKPGHAKDVGIAGDRPTSLHRQSGRGGCAGVRTDCQARSSHPSRHRPRQGTDRYRSRRVASARWSRDDDWLSLPHEAERSGQAPLSQAQLCDLGRLCVPDLPRRVPDRGLVENATVQNVAQRQPLQAAARSAGDVGKRGGRRAATSAFMAFCSFSNARASTCRTRSREMP